MTLPDVILGGGHISAHNNSRHTVNSRQRWRSKINSSAPAIAVAGGALAPYLYGGPGVVTQYVNGVLGCTATFRAEIGPGTWSARVWYAKIWNLGIIKIEYSLDEGASWVTAHAGLDEYAPSSVVALYFDITGIVVPVNVGTILWRWTSIAKNVASSGYLVMCGDVDLTRTV